MTPETLAELVDGYKRLWVVSTNDGLFLMRSTEPGCPYFTRAVSRARWFPTRQAAEAESLAIGRLLNKLTQVRTVAEVL